MEWNIFFFVRNQWDNMWTGLRHYQYDCLSWLTACRDSVFRGVNLVASTSNRTPWFPTTLLFACPVEPLIIYLGQTRKHFDCVGLDKVSQWVCHGGSCSDWKKFVDVFFKFQRRVSLESGWDWLHVSQPTTLGVRARGSHRHAQLVDILARRGRRCVTSAVVGQMALWTCPSAKFMLSYLFFQLLQRMKKRHLWTFVRPMWHCAQRILFVLSASFLHAECSDLIGLCQDVCVAETWPVWPYFLFPSSPH